MMPPTAIRARPHRFTVSEYHRMGEAGILGEDDQVELIEGEIVEVAAIGRRHASTVDRLTALFVNSFGDRAHVAVQNPVVHSDITEPQPDVVLLRPREDFYAGADRDPEATLLVVEVAATSLGYDGGVKFPLYARAGVPEVRIVDLQGRRVERHLGPGPAGYADSRGLDMGERLAPTAFPDVEVGVEEILGPEPDPAP